MKKIEEQLESIEEVLTHLVKKISVIEETAQKMAADDSTRKLLADLKSSLTKMPSGQQLQSQMASIQTSIENLPRQSQVRHHHHFDIQSRGFIISAIVLIVITGICVAIALNYYNENRRLDGNDVKYRMIRQINPGLAAWADSTYFTNPDSALLETKRREDFDLVVRDAEANFTRMQQEAENARKVLKSLKVN